MGRDQLDGAAVKTAEDAVARANEAVKGGDAGRMRDAEQELTKGLTSDRRSPLPFGDRKRGSRGGEAEQRKGNHQDGDVIDVDH